MEVTGRRSGPTSNTKLVFNDQAGLTEINIIWQTALIHQALLASKKRFLQISDIIT